MRNAFPALPDPPATAATGLDHHHHVLSSTSGSLGCSDHT